MLLCNKGGFEVQGSVEVCLCVCVFVCVWCVWFADVHVYFQGSFASSKSPSIIYSIAMQFLAEDCL